MTLNAKAQRAFEKDTVAATRTAVKGSGWRVSKGVLFRQEGDWFFAVHRRRLSPDLTDGFTVELMGKPMALDPLYWEVMGLEDNASQPLSFRYWGAFVCGSPMLASETIAASDPETTAAEMVASASRMLPRAKKRLATEIFSEIAANNAGTDGQWRMAETVLHARRLEGDEVGAEALARDKPSTVSVSSLFDDPLRAGRDHNAIFLAMKDQTTAPTGDRPEADEKRGFWARLFGR